jgi:hypothetical protein
VNTKDRQEFVVYLRNCTNRQIQGVYDKEKSAGRKDYAKLALQEAKRRGIELER